MIIHFNLLRLLIYLVARPGRIQKIWTGMVELRNPVLPFAESRNLDFDIHQQ
jgi:hypothetical protein